MKQNKVQLIDAGTGNLQSVFNALQKQEALITVVSDPQNLNLGIRTVLPGVGAFRSFMDGLSQRNLTEAIFQIAEIGTPLLGICVGMQAFFETSEELGSTPGLGLIPGSVIRFPDQNEFKVPHTGWNQITYTQENGLFKNIVSGSHFYFNHSYFCNPLDLKYQSTETEYSVRFTSAVGWNNISGVQFHPEKSQSAGLKLLANFLDL